MSNEVTPEWLRIKREVEAIIRGVWQTLDELEERLSTRTSELETRVDKLEQTVDELPARTRLFKLNTEDKP